MSHGGRKIVSNSMILMGAEFFRKVLRMVLVIFSARILGDALYGQYSFGIGFTMLFWILADLGIHQLLIREVARRPGEVKTYLANALTVKLLLSCVCIGAMAAGAFLTKKPPEVLRMVAILGGALILESMVELFKSIFQAFQQMRYDAAATVIETVSIVGLGLASLLLGGGIVSLAFTYLAAYAVTLMYVLIVTAVRFTPLRLAFDPKLVRHMFKEGLPIGINHFFAMIYTHVDTTMLSLMINDEVVGWYNAAFRLRFALQFVGGGIVTAVYPALSSLYAESGERFVLLYEKTFKVLLLIGISMAALVSVLADKIVLFLYDTEYIQSTVILQIMVWSLVFVFLNLLMASTTRASDRQRFTAKVVAFCAFLNVGLNWMWIPKHTTVGASLATLVTEIVSFSAQYMYLRSKKISVPVLRWLPKVLLINAVTAGAVFLLRFIHVVPLFTIGMILSAALTVLARYFTREEIAFLSDFVRSLRRNSAGKGAK